MKLLKQFIAVLVFSLCLSAPSAAEQILIPIYVDASSTLQVSGYNYSPLNIQDFNCETAWTEGVKGTGIGEELYLHITEGTVITGGLIYPGYQKSEDLFYKNAAPNSIRISSGGKGEVQIFQTAANIFYGQNGEGYYFEMASPIVSDGVVTISIEGVRPGWKYEDTCISELRLYGEIPGQDPSGTQDMGQDNLLSHHLSGMAQQVYTLHGGYNYPIDDTIYSGDLSFEEQAFLLYWYQYNVEDPRIGEAAGGYNVAYSYDMREITKELFGENYIDEIYALFKEKYVESSSGELVYMSGTGDFGDAGSYYFEAPDQVWAEGERIAVSGRIMGWNANMSSYVHVSQYTAFYYPNETWYENQLQTFRFSEVRVGNGGMPR